MKPTARQFSRLVPRVVLAIVSLTAAVVLFLAYSPGVLRGLVLALTGWVEVPMFAGVPEAPMINAPKGALPRGWVALSVEAGGRSTACGFLLSAQGQQVGVSAAHAVPWTWPENQAIMRAPDGEIVALMGQVLRRGPPGWRQQPAQDYVIWQEEEMFQSALLLQPDPRGQAQPGESVRVYGRGVADEGGSQYWPAVVMAVVDGVTWIQLEASFNPSGYSGCPVLSEHTGQVVGMAVLGKDRPPVVMGVLPVKLIDSAQAEAVAPRQSFDQ